MIGAIWHDSRLMSIMAGFFSAVAFLLLGYASLQWLIHLPVFDIRTLQLSGDVERINPVGFQANVVPVIRGSFFSIDLNDVREQVQQQPWVRKAVIQRIWPNGLNIQIQSHKPLAYWGDNLLINTYGEVFSANVAEVGEDGLPITLSGPAGTELMVAQTYIKLAKALHQLDMNVARVDLSDRYGWSLKTDTGLQLALGRDQEPLDIRHKIERFLWIYPQLQGQLMKKVDSIDLRYPRAVAVKGERMPKEPTKAKALKTKLN